MSTIIINNATKEQAGVISKLAKMLKLQVTLQENENSAKSSKAEIDAAIIAYENGRSKALRLSVKDFKKMIGGIR